ncbi:aconitate hydratase AcnA [Arcobacter sp. F2176]|uniref:aconitate hydratase AcnA n=1 Tax=Arcobacter sp. F2176 TaxID=2044511 RepID=UPI00100AF0CC|nr:aconitate hydratase AcnA [Arcobacter sp. F2176]RXJ81574.1 aconitate hydratase AcnA [Arcobacter sp. F2176]
MKKEEFKSHFEFAEQKYTFYDLKKLQTSDLTKINKLPYSIRILLENLLRNFDQKMITEQDIKELASWKKKYETPYEIPYHPARVIMQDFTGIPAIVDLASMRDAIAKEGKDASLINPLVPVDLIVDHSVQVDFNGTEDSLDKNVQMEYKRNEERYSVLKWAQVSFDNLRIVPPRSGICHQVNLEYLGQIVQREEKDGEKIAYCDTLVGTDSHTTMINSIGVMGWGVGGIEAEAVMLGQPYYMPIPEVIGLRLSGEIKEGITGTDVVLAITKILREYKVVEKFVEVYGPGLKSLTLPDRATISNMSPEFGSTMAFFPVDDETLRYMKETNRADQAQFVESYTKNNMLFYDEENEPEYTDTIEFDLSSVKPSIAGPKEPHQHLFLDQLQKTTKEEAGSYKSVDIELETETIALKQSDIVIAAITSCTNTSNPFVMLGAGLIAKKAVELGLSIKPYVKTSLAPGSKVVTDYLKSAQLDKYLDKLGFNLTAYGCTTCIGNSGPLKKPINDAIIENKLSVASVLSGNRNFEARIHPYVRQNYLMSPMLVMIYAIAGTVDIDLYKDPIAFDKNENPIFMKDLWPQNDEVRELINKNVTSEQYKQRYAQILQGDENWKSLPITKSDTYKWIEKSSYIKKAPFFDNFTLNTTKKEDIQKAKILAMFGDTVTTDHISPAGIIPPEYPAGKYLQEEGIKVEEFNSYGSRRGNHEVMMRGTFANVRINNNLVYPKEGGFSKYMPNEEEDYIYNIAMKYKQEKSASVILAGKEYGTGSSRDWAAKGTSLLGVSAVIAQSYERIHRSNLVGMGVLPLQFIDTSWKDLGLDGSETIDILEISEITPRTILQVKAYKTNGKVLEFQVLCRLDTQIEVEYYKNNGILEYVLRKIIKEK